MSSYVSWTSNTPFWTTDKNMNRFSFLYLIMYHCLDINVDLAWYQLDEYALCCHMKLERHVMKCNLFCYHIRPSTYSYQL